MSHDLTRWNRAALSRFRYLEGNAVTFLDDLARAFLDETRPLDRWTAIHLFTKTLAADATRRERLEYLSEQQAHQLEEYSAAPRDLAWEIARAFARACHVLTEHIDAYANESYLRTATQWENLRRLVTMLGYAPAPPSSASTHLGLDAKDGKSGTVPEGFQVKYSPDDGSSPVVFETLSDLDVDYRLNDLRPLDYDHNFASLAGSSELDLEEAIEGLALGDPIVIEDPTGKALFASILASVTVAEESTKLTLTTPVPTTNGGAAASYEKGNVLVHVLPAESLEVLGPVKTIETSVTEIRLQIEPVGLVVDEVLYVSDASGKGAFVRLAAASGRSLTFKEAVEELDLSTGFVTRARSLPVERESETQLRADGDVSSAVTGSELVMIDAGQLKKFTVTAVSVEPLDPDTDAPWYTTITVDQTLPTTVETVWIPPAGKQWETDSYLAKEDDSSEDLPLTLTTAIPKKLAANDAVVLLHGGLLAWARVSTVSIDSTTGQAEITVDAWQVLTESPRFYLEETRLYGPFKEQVRVVDWNQNDQAITGTQIQLADLAEAPTALTAGRRVLVEQEQDDGSYADPVLLTLKTVEVSGGAVVLTVDRSFPLTDDSKSTSYTKARTVLRANVVEAGHGQSRPQKILGSGNASLSSQEFVLKTGEVSFVSDTSMPAGVAADVALTVDGVEWTQVHTLYEHGPTDAVFAVRMTEDGYVRFLFGDGEHGRRLPTGSNNVKVTIRQGTGVRGNVAAGSLAKAVKPNAYVDSVRQPMEATGGADLESEQSIREDAPESVLTLGRAVSLRDFELLAAANSSIWQAHAVAEAPLHARFTRVHVHVVPSGGTELSDDLRDAIQGTLANHAIPGVEIAVSRYVPHAVQLAVTIAVNSSAYDPDTVKAAVEWALRDGFSLEHRKLGQPLYRSEVVRIVEGIEGVAYSVTSLADGSGGTFDPELQVIPAAENEVIYLVQTSDLAVEVEEVSDL